MIEVEEVVAYNPHAGVVQEQTRPRDAQESRRRPRRRQPQPWDGPAGQWVPRQPIRRGCTTVVVRNVPKRCSQEDFLAMVRIHGMFDYFHLPYNLLHQRLLGYGFVNFCSHEMALAFQEEWHGRVLARAAGQKPLNIATASTQGWHTCLARVKFRKVNLLAQAGYLPLIYRDGAWLSTSQIAQEIASLRPASTRGEQGGSESEEESDGE